MKIALFGGTFDPVHTAHLRMAGMLADELSLDRVLFMPTFVPPHKVKVGMAPAEDLQTIPAALIQLRFGKIKRSTPAA